MSHNGACGGGGVAMAGAGGISLDDAIDGQTVRRSTIIMLTVATLAMLSDGFDLAAIGYIGPELVKSWHVTRAALVPVFSAGIFGLLLGAPLLGFAGDRLGRKTALMGGLGLVAIFTLAVMSATTLTEFAVLRFLTGVGLGGVIPNVIALVAEAAPKRRRGMFIVIVNFGVPIGISLPGLAAAALVPSYGWPVLLLVGGLLPLVVLAVVAASTPESIRFLAQRGGHEAKLRRMLATIRPDLPANAVLMPSKAIAPAATGSPRLLFGGGLAAITPLLWLALAANQMANFFSLTWLPTLLQSAGSTTAQAGVNASLFSMGGIAGGLCLTVIVDRLGVIPMVALFLAGVPLMAAIGSPLPPYAAAAVIAGAGFCVTGVNFTMGATLGVIYPTAVRSLGTGWCQAMGRVGSMTAPLIGGALLGLDLPLQDLLLVPAGALAIGAAAAAAITALCLRRFQGLRIDDCKRQDAPAASSLVASLAID